jgi:hypothetical protein
MTTLNRTVAVAVPVVAIASCAVTQEAENRAATLDRESRMALAELYATESAAKTTLGTKAVAVLVFPSITKPGCSSEHNTARAF